MFLNDVDNSVDGGKNHLTHLTQFESNDGVDGCENYTLIAKNNSESLRSDVKGHVDQFRVGGLKDDRESIDNGQMDNDDKNNGDKNNQNPSKGVYFSSTADSQNTSNRSHNHHYNYHNNLNSYNCR
eukprot:7404566-Ditylum_brightwellii.AAC.1